MFRYKKNRERMVADGFNVSDYEGMNLKAESTYTRRWQQVKVYQCLQSASGTYYLGEII